MMHPEIAKEVAALPRLSFAQLRARYAELFQEPTRVGNRAWLVKRIAWRLQALAEGDLSQRARQQAAQLANDADLRLLPPEAHTGQPTSPSKKHAADSAVPKFNSVGPVPHHKHDGRLPQPGTVITRLYKGQTLQVEVLPLGFAHQGKVYQSLSGVAKAITGSHCNGLVFFRLNQERNNP